MTMFKCLRSFFCKEERPTEECPNYYLLWKQQWEEEWKSELITIENIFELRVDGYTRFKERIDVHPSVSIGRLFNMDEYHLREQDIECKLSYESISLFSILLEPYLGKVQNPEIFYGVYLGDDKIGILPIYLNSDRKLIRSRSVKFTNYVFTVNIIDMFPQRTKDTDKFFNALITKVKSNEEN